MNYIFRQVHTNEINRVCEVLSNVVSHMKSIGFTQWDEGYPNKDVLEKDIAYHNLHGAYKDTVLVGFVALNNHQEEEYKDISWQYDEPCLVVHRLQVDPIYRGQNIAYKLIQYAEHLAKDTGCKSIRLDTRCDNIPAIKLYEKLGYEKCWHVHFPRMPLYKFPCFEKEIL